MTTETAEVEGEDEEEGEDYYLAAPEPIVLSSPEGQFVIFDPPSFAAHHGRDSAHFEEGKVFLHKIEGDTWAELGAPPAKQKPKLVQ